MSGAGIRLFTAGSVLTAQQVNAYLMEQAIAFFANAGARSSAYGGVGQPTLADGMFSYLSDEKKLYFYNGTTTAWEEVGAQISDEEVTPVKLAPGPARAGFNSVRKVVPSATYTLVLSDLAKLLELHESSPITLTIPTNATAAFAIGDRIDIMQTSTGAVTVVGAAGVTLNANENQYKLNGQWAIASLIKRAVDTWVLVGNITA